MAQVFDIEARLENVGDYAWFKTDEGDLVLAFRFESEHWAFYSKDYLYFSGSDRPRRETFIRDFPFLGDFRNGYSWLVNASNSLEWGINDIECSNDIRLNIVTYPMALTTDDTLFTELPSTEDEQSVEDVENFISDMYETRMKYSGYHSYHSHRGDYMNLPTTSHRGHRIGVELEVEFKDDDLRDDFVDMTSNWFYLESDGSLGDYGCEIITIPLRPQEAKSEDFWSPLTNYLKDKACSWDTGRCGLHVHIGREILGRSEEEQSETLGKLLYLYHHYVKDTRLNIKIYGRERGYNDHDGKTQVGDAIRILGKEVLKVQTAKDAVKKEMISKSNRDRYFDINIRNEATIEFRKGRGSINAKRIAMVVDYSERMCIYAKSTPWQQIGYEDFVKFLKSTVQNPNLLEIINGYS